MVQTAPHGELVRNGELKISRFLGTCAELRCASEASRTTDNGQQTRRERVGDSTAEPPQIES